MTLLEGIKEQSEWVVKAFKSDRVTLDFSLESLKKVDEFFDRDRLSGAPRPNSRLAQNPGWILFAVASYVGETIIRNNPGAEWVTDEEDPNKEVNIQVKLGNGMLLMPAQRVVRRFKNGPEDSIHAYGVYVMEHLARDDHWDKVVSADLEPAEVGEKRVRTARPWWKLW